MWVSSCRISRYRIFSSPCRRYPSPATTFPAVSSMYMYMSSGTTSIRQSRRTSSRNPSGKILRKAGDRLRPGNTSRIACFPAFTFRFTSTEAIPRFESCASEKKVRSRTGAPRPLLPTRSSGLLPEPGGEILVVAPEPRGVYPDLLHHLFHGPADARRRMALEEGLDLPRPVRTRERLRDRGEPADEESGRGIPPIQFIPILLDESPREVPPEAWSACRDASDHDRRILEPDCVRQGPSQGFPEEGFPSGARKGNEEADLFFLENGLLFETPEGLVRRLSGLLGGEPVDDGAQVRRQGCGVLEIGSKTLPRLVQHRLVEVVAQTGEHGHAAEGAEMPLSLPRDPTRARDDRSKQVPRVSIKGFEVRSVGDQAFESDQRIRNP